MGRRPSSSKDPEAPKSAASAQQFFNKARRLSLKVEAPNLIGVEIAARLMEEWRDMDASSRAPYTKQATTDKARFEREMASYQANPAFLQATKGGNRLQKDPMRPKKPKSAYLYFGEATRAELTESNPGIRIETLSKLIGEEWKKLSEEAKAPYVKQAEKDQVRYRREMESYTPSDAYLAAKEAFKKAKKKKKKASLRLAASGVDDDDDEKELQDGEGEIELKKENAALKKQVAALGKEKEKLEKQIEKLTEKAVKASGGKAASKTAAENAPTKANGKVKEPAANGESSAPIDDPAHYYAWTKKILGAKGEKADPDMLKVLEAKGPKGLAKVLIKRYHAEHK